MICLKPKVIVNQYNHKKMFVPCGECEACKLQKSIDSTERLNIELSSYKFTLFATLHYDNNNIPFVPVGSRFICRLGVPGISGVTSIQLLEKMDCPLNISEYRRIYNFDDSCIVGTDPVGVIYYRDLQLFYKRFRKRFNNEYPGIKFRHAECSEYGTKRKRPHFHILLGFDSKNQAEFARKILYDCWRMCNRLRFNKFVVYASKGVGSYLSSYVAGYIGSDELCTIKRFRPRFRRSNEISYGIDEKDVETLKAVIVRNYGKRIFDFKREDFQILRSGKNTSVSVSIVQSKVFNSYFQKLKGYSQLSFIAFCLCAYRIYRIEEYKSRFRRYPEYEEELTSLDLNFFRSYKRFCVLLTLDVFNFKNFVDYVYLFYSISNFYNSLLIYEQMKMYETLTPKEYVQFCYQTPLRTKYYSYSFSRLERIYNTVGYSMKDNNFINRFYYNKKDSDIKQLLVNNRQKLIGKHIKDLTNNQTY